jgi:uncharacterized Zn finger protein
MAWYFGTDGFPRYLSAGERRARAFLEARKLEKQGRTLDPVRLAGRKIATSFWGKAWCENLESYSDFANRLPRGRSYLRTGSVLDLRIGAGRIDALVCGTELYEVSVELEKLSRARWRGLVKRSAGRIDSVVDLLRGQVPEALLSAMIDRRSGMFPSPEEMRLSCSCPDRAALCKHLAAVLYGVGARFDKEPETFFILRSVKMADLVAKSTAKVAAAPAAVAEGSLEAIFGIELDRSRKSRRRA